MRVDRLWLTDFRNHADTDVTFDPELTLVTGANGEGKTNLLEAISLLAGMKSFRGAMPDAMIRKGAERAIVRSEVTVGDRSVLIELEVRAAGRSRIQVNRQAVRRARDLADVVAVVVFSPDDLELIKGAPSLRRGLLDDVCGHVSVSFRAARADLDRVLRQRNTLLKQSGGRLDDDAASTLDVWDDKLVDCGEAVTAGREELVGRLGPVVQEFYEGLAGPGAVVSLSYDAPWRGGGLAAALATGRNDDVRRGLTLVGPHRDELQVELDGLAARTHASQGEQRSLALALRLAMHRELTTRLGHSPVVLLDDVFSELDDGRAVRLVGCLPSAQTIVTTATGTVPTDIEPGRRLTVSQGSVHLDPAPIR